MTDHTPDPQDPIGSDLVHEDACFAKIVLEFVEGLNDRLRQMETAIRVGDFETLRVAAHRLKGSGGGYGYPLLSRMAAELEAHAKAGLVDECMQAFGELRALCERVVVDTDQE